MAEATGFREALLEAVDCSLLVLGESVKQAIYHYIERKYRVKREEIPEKLEILQKASEGLLGAGSKVIDKLIAKNLYSRLGLNFEPHDDWTLVEYVNNAKKALEGK